MKKTSKTQTSENTAKDFRVLHGEPIFIPHDPQPSEESPLPSENGAWPGFILVGGSIVALLCAWWFAPTQMDAFLKNLIHQIFQFAGQP